ncbi:type IV pilus twitching motility protein PilT [bacterium]|nr:type IV pilus twitching motility protein PilT [bacterium]
MSGIVDYLVALHDSGGSDLHLASGVPPIVRVHGILTALDADVLQQENVAALACEILSDEQRSQLLETKNIDFALEIDLGGQLGVWRYRGNAYFQKNGLNVVLRAIPAKVPTLEELNLPASLEKFVNYHHGLVLATGQAGCGKSSTIAALVNLINETRAVHVITVEDPIEYLHINKKALINQRQVGRDVETFSLALKGALREDPDVIFVGELRDLETISLAITAAETGHLVLGTLHTNSAAKAVDRLIDAFPIDQQAQIRTMLSESLRGVVAQQLIPRADGQGRVVAVEILINNVSIANAIRDGKIYQIPMSMQTGRKIGMCTMDSSIQKLYEQGIITKDEACARSVNKVPYRQPEQAAEEQL